ncbi:hypothetical protein [Massilia sp. BKSP1R2A-1]|uniref:hypothetical protein n=1 Tax=Massilia sp. BKSP1R2A-1 TaxID=3422595 RepID=UPI003D32AC8D
MKSITIGGVLIAGYFIYQATALAAISEMMSSKKQCEDTILEVLKSAHSMSPNKATEKMMAGCQRMEKNADTAEKVLKALP